MDENEQGQYGLLCVQCGADTGCNLDVSHMCREHVDELLANWLCSDCLDERDAAESAGVAGANIERLEAAAAMGDEAAKARLLDPDKITPRLDAAVALYLTASQSSGQHGRAAASSDSAAVVNSARRTSCTTSLRTSNAAATTSAMR